MHPTIKDYIAPGIRRDFSNENIVAHLRRTQSFAISLLPDDTATGIRNAVISKLDSLQSEALHEINRSIDDLIAYGIDEFCKKKDICPSCVVGGYKCGSDHK